MRFTVSAQCQGGSTVINNEEFLPISVVSNDLEAGRLAFGKLYVDMTSLRSSGYSEDGGVLAEISFKVLKEERTEITFERRPSASGTTLGVMIFNWDGYEIPDCKVQESVVIN